MTLIKRLNFDCASAQCASAREKLIFTDLSYSYDSIRLGSYFYSVISIKDLPEETYAALISRFKLPFHFYFSTNIYVPSFSKEVSSLKQKRRLSHSLALNQGRTTDLDSEAKYADTENVLKEIISENQKIFLVSFVIVLRDQNIENLEKKTRATLQKLRELGLEGLREDVAAFKVFKSVIPASCEKTPRLRRLKTDNVSDLLPIYKKGTGNEKPVCLFKTRDNGLFKFDIFDEAQSVWNFLISGASGSGKSFLVNNIILQFLKEFNEKKEPPLIRILDIGGSYKKITEILGGQYCEINIDSKNSINPFELAHGNTEPTPEKISSLKAILETILKEEDKQNLPKFEKSLLESEITNLYKDVKANSANSKRCPRFSDLKDRWEKSENPILKQFSTILYPWTSGTYGKLLNPEKSTISLSRVIKNGVDLATFDLKGLSTKPELQKVMLLVLTDLLWQDIASSPGRLKLLILDECWQLLKSATDFIEECYRTFRKYGASIGAISQAIEDFSDSPIATAILNNAPTRFILSQKGDLSILKEILKLNDREIDLISGLSQKKGEYSEFFLAQNGHHILRLCPSSLEYHLSTTHHKDKKLEQEYQEKYPDLSYQELYHKLATDHPRGALN